MVCFLSLIICLIFVCVNGLAEKYFVGLEETSSVSCNLALDILAFCFNEHQKNHHPNAILTSKKKHQTSKHYSKT